MKTLRFVFQAVVLVTLVLALWPTAAVGASETSGASASKPLFTVTDLGTIKGGSYSFGNWINDRGQVVGWSGLPGDENQDGFLWRNGAIRDLGRLDGPTSSAYVINQSGVIVGQSDTILPGGSVGWVPVMWDGSGKIHNLGTLGGPTGLAADINDRGQIVGTADTSVYLQDVGAYQYLGFVMQNGKKHALQNPIGGHNTWATDINERNQVAGFVTVPGEQGQHCALWSGSLTTNPKFTDLGSMGGQWCKSWYIDDRGMVVGETITADGYYLAWKWQNGKATILKPLPGALYATAHGISNLGFIMGWTYTPGDPDARAVLWYGDNVVELNALIPADSGWYLVTAIHANARGQIVGSGWVNGQFHGFLLTPTRSLPQALAALPAVTATSTSHPDAVGSPTAARRVIQHPFGRQLGR